MAVSQTPSLMMNTGPLLLQSQADRWQASTDHVQFEARPTELYPELVSDISGGGRSVAGGWCRQSESPLCRYSNTAPARVSSSPALHGYTLPCAEYTTNGSPYGHWRQVKPNMSAMAVWMFCDKADAELSSIPESEDQLRALFRQLPPDLSRLVSSPDWVRLALMQAAADGQTTQQHCVSDRNLLSPQQKQHSAHAELPTKNIPHISPPLMSPLLKDTKVEGLQRGGKDIGYKPRWASDGNTEFWSRRPSGSPRHNKHIAAKATAATRSFAMRKLVASRQQPPETFQDAVVFSRIRASNGTQAVEISAYGPEVKQRRVGSLRYALDALATATSPETEEPPGSLLAAHSAQRIVSFIANELMGDHCHKAAAALQESLSHLRTAERDVSQTLAMKEATSIENPASVSEMWTAFANALSKGDVGDAAVAVYHTHLDNLAIHGAWCTLLDRLDESVPEVVEFFESKGYRLGRGRGYTTMVLTYFEDHMRMHRKKVKVSIWRGALISAIIHTFGRGILLFLPASFYTKFGNSVPQHRLYEILDIIRHHVPELCQWSNTIESQGPLQQVQSPGLCVDGQTLDREPVAVVKVEQNS